MKLLPKLKGIDEETLNVNLHDPQRARTGQEPPSAGPSYLDMLKFIPFSPTLVAPRFTVPGYIGDGLVIIAGQHGIGKTTAVLSLACIVAGIHGQNELLAPRHWRHVVYITEDPDQAQRILYAVAGGDSSTILSITERVHVVEARRLPPEEFVRVGEHYRKMLERENDGVTIAPLVVLDTKSAVFVLEDENDNAEASRIMSALKQDFSGLPTWIVGHMSKAAASRNEAAALSIRGASSLEGDANQVLFLIGEDDARYLVRGKTRFEAKYRDILVKPSVRRELAINEFKELVPVTLRYVTFEPLTGQEREQLRASKKAQAQRAAEKARNDAILTVVRDARCDGEALSKDVAARRAGAKKTTAMETIERMLDDGQLAQVTIPPQHRDNPKRTTLLIDIAPEERDAFLATGEVPSWKLRQVAAWAGELCPLDVKNGDADTTEAVATA